MEAVDFDFDIDLLLSDELKAGDPSSVDSETVEIFAPVRVIESAEMLPKCRWSFSSLLLWTRSSAPDEAEGEGSKDSDDDSHLSLSDPYAADPGPPRLSHPSALLSAKQAEVLSRVFPLLHRYSPWTMRYSVLLHGADLVSFFKLTQSARYTLLLIQTDTEEVLGGFASTPWTPAKEFCKYRASFSCLLHRVLH